MIAHYFFKYIRIILLSIIFSTITLNFFQTLAQSIQPINTNEIKTGSLSTESPEQYYSLIARAGQILNIEIRRVSGDIIPQFSVLLGKESLGVWYAYKHTTVGDDFSGGQIKFDVDGQYTIRVTSRHPDSSEGQYVLSVNATVPPKALTIGENADGEIVGGETRIFTFQSIPESPIVISVDIKGNVSDFTAKLKNSRGDVIGSFQPPLQEGSFNIPKGQKDYTLEIANTSNGSIIQFDILLTAAAVETQSEATPSGNSLPQLPNSGDCVAATLSAVQVNIRPNPSRTQPAIAVMSPFKVYRVLARNQDDTWYQIQVNDNMGWVFANVTRLGGNCEAVPRK